jgi:type II secretory pathway pseudopilin PulG
MVRMTTRGFTIIEVMLFLSITGFLFVALMVGVNTNINQQRYRDSINSFAGLLQQQYAEVSNTRNDRDDGWRCSGSVAEQDPGNGQARGTTECVVLGRYIRTIDNAAKIETGTIIGSEPSSDTILTGDTAALTAYAPHPSTFETSQYTPEWGAVLRDKDNHPASFTVLILRSPLSGLMRVFATIGPMPSNLTDIMTDDAARQKINTCIVADGWLTGPTQAVVLDAATAGPNGVSTLGEGSQC